MPYAPLLSPAEIDAGLAQLTEWQRADTWIVRSVHRRSFRAAIELVDRVADAAESADHHPDIEIAWRRVTFRLTTKAAGGLTQRDLAMAASIDALVEAGRD